MMIRTFMKDDKNNVLVVHCNAGKGRTGTAIAAILMYFGVFERVDECLKLFAYQRFECFKGVS